MNPRTAVLASALVVAAILSGCSDDSAPVRPPVSAPGPQATVVSASESSARSSAIPATTASPGSRRRAAAK